MTTDYSKFRLPLKTTKRIDLYYTLGRDAFENGYEEFVEADPAFTMTVLAESEDVKDLNDLKSHWRNGWMDAYQNKYHGSTTD